MKHNLPPSEPTFTLTTNTLTEKFKDREHLLITLNAMRKQIPKKTKRYKAICGVIHELSMRGRNGYHFRKGVLHCYTSSFKMFP